MRTLTFIQGRLYPAALALGLSLLLPALTGAEIAPSAAPSLDHPASADDWPQFRGPKGDRISAATGVPLTWSANRNVKWKRPVPGRGRSSPTRLGERIWLTTASEFHVRAFSAGPDPMQQAEQAGRTRLIAEAEGLNLTPTAIRFDRCCGRKRVLSSQ